MAGSPSGFLAPIAAASTTRRAKSMCAGNFWRAFCSHRFWCLRVIRGRISVLANLARRPLFLRVLIFSAAFSALQSVSVLSCQLLYPFAFLFSTGFCYLRVSLWGPKPRLSDVSEIDRVFVRIGEIVWPHSVSGYFHVLLFPIFILCWAVA